MNPAFCSPIVLPIRTSTRKTLRSPRTLTRTIASLQDASVSTISAAAARRGYRIEDESMGPLLKLNIYRTSGESYAGSISGAILPNNRLHIESYKATRRDPKGGLIAVSPGMIVFIAALAFGYQKGARNVYGLAINDAPDQYRRLVRYLKKFGGEEVQKVTGSLSHVPARMFYGGLGTVIRGDVEEMLVRGIGMLERTSPVLPSL